MALFGKKNEGGMLDVIRCDEENYLIWKWRPSGEANSTNKENSIRWGSSLRVKDGEVAVFVYEQSDRVVQDFIEGPFDEIIKTSNFPIISNIIGLAYAGKSPFQAEVYFINLAANQKLPFGVPYFDVFDNRFLDFPVRTSARGSMIFNITDYRAFIKLHRLINFDFEKFRVLVRDAVIKYVKGTIANAPSDNGIPVLQIERKLLEINDLITPRIAKAFQEDFGVNLVRFDLDTIEVDKDTPEYKELRSITADLEVKMRQKQNDINMLNLEQAQAINAENVSETMRIQREEAQRFQSLQTQTQNLAAHQVNQQTNVLMTAAENLGQMSAMNLGGGSGGGSGGGDGFNPVGVMTGMAVGGALGGQMANMMNMSGQSIQAQMSAPPPPPQVQYNVSVNGQSIGPFSMAQLQEMARAGQLAVNHHVWKPGMANWDLAGNVAELGPVFAAASPPPPPAPPPLRPNDLKDFDDE
jgi:membrane protease subunit (stomatin/prohibitin family)